MADNKNTQAADVNEQIKIRMDKLKALQDAGKDQIGRASCRERV